MAAPVFFITTHRIKPGRRPAFEALTHEYMEFVRANEPRAWAHYAYVDDSTDEVALVQVHPDAASADAHVAAAGDLIARGLELTDTLTAEVYGELGPVARAALEHNADAGVAVTVAPTELGGFHRAPAA
jgi:hypothetical protein